MTRTKPDMPAELVDLHPDAWTEPFWLAAREHRLVAPRCTTCGTFRMPPSPFCRSCRNQDVDWVELSGKGTVYSFIVTYQPLIPQLADYIPHVPAVIELDDAPGIRLVSNLVDTEVEEIEIGMPVTVTWDDVHENATVPRFRPTADVS